MSRRRFAVRLGALALGAVLTLLALFALGACTRSGGGSGASGGEAAQQAVNGAAPAPGTGKAASAPDRADAVTADVAIGTSKIRTADLSVQVAHQASVAAAADAAEQIALRSGGEVDADDRTSGRNPTATLVLRVAPEDLTATLTALAHLGSEKSRHLSTQDVTSKVADVNSRVVSARESIARLRTLYTHATKVADVINIESELSQRESDLESLEAQQRALAAETSTARITLSLSRAAAKPLPAKPAHHRSGFVGGLENGWDAFTRAAAGFATALGAVLPFAVLLIALLVIGRLLWPRVRPARRPAP